MLIQILFGLGGGVVSVQEIWLGLGFYFNPLKIKIRNLPTKLSFRLLLIIKLVENETFRQL